MVNIDETPISFGKYSGKSPNEIAEEDSGYLIWAYETIGKSFCSKSLYEACYLDEAEYEDEMCMGYWLDTPK